MIFKIIVLLSVLSVVCHCKEPCTKKCSTLTKHYEELGCTPVTEKDHCCPTRSVYYLLLNALRLSIMIFSQGEICKMVILKKSILFI